MHIFELCHEKTWVGGGGVERGRGVWNERDTELTAYSCSVINTLTLSLESIKATMYLLDPNVQV